MDAANTGQNVNLASKVGHLRRPGVKLRLARLFVAAFMLLGFAEAVYAFCTLDNNPAPFIRNDTSISYCELCGYGYVTFEVANPFRTANLTNVQVVVNLGSSGLVYEPTAPNSITYSVNGGPAIPGAPPAGAGSVLTFNLPDVAPVNGNSAGTLAVTFAVRRINNPESLVTANRAFSTILTFDTNPTDASCTGYGGPYSDFDVLPLREPDPRILKRGWNYDAGQRQGSWSDPVFGTNGDDIVWRIRIRNRGLADLQDLRFDDLMQTGSMDINYACPTATSANAVAANDGVLPGGSPCVAATNDIDDFIVTDPFGQNGTNVYPWGDSVEVDVAAGTTTSVYLVGKVRAIIDGDAVDGSCVTSRTNTVNDVQWGCEVQTPAGGISSTSTGYTPGDTATLVTRYMDGRPALQVNRQLTGTNTSQPVGSKGTMNITITNNSGGSVRFPDALADLRDVLPPEYVMDPTYTPTLVMNPRYSSYDGMVDRIEWTNPDPNPLTIDTNDATTYLNNTAPEFNLYSSTVHPEYPDQRDMMRHGDVLTITFRVVLIESDYYDRVANLDVTPEEFTALDQDGRPTDPTYNTPLSNTLTVEFETFCASQGTQTFTLTGNGTGNPTGSNIAADPEDLDVAIGGAVFILTNDPAQQLTLPVQLTNNGGHDARDYHLFVTFGATMEVISAPAGCSVISPLSGSPPQPDPWKVWVDPPTATIPTTATVYECTSPTVIAPGQTVTYNFNVIKTADPVRLAIDDLTFRADVVGEITLSDGTPLWFPAPILRADGQLDRANNYSLDTVWARVIGFNLKKTQLGQCNENLPATVDGNGFETVEIGEECSFRIETGGWFGFETPGFAYIAVQNIDVVDEVPDGQAYISSTDPYAESTSLIGQNGDMIPPAIPAVTEGWFDWRFNVADANRIEVADEWFIVNTTTRLLNKPIDSRAAPNVHGANSYNVLNSTFDATFQNNNTGAIEQYTLGPSTVGYPNEPIRRVDLTVSEPLLTVVKEVCNETLYGVGPACSNWTTLADDGDTYNSYIYRITVSNEAASGGLTRSPAYDVVVTDTLDASDLVLVAPFDSDGLDNDADSVFDEPGTNEGSINDNVVLNGVPPVITFSHTHSTALQRIDAGASVQLYYRVDPDQRIAPQQVLTNIANASYDTLYGSTNESGNQTVDPRPNSDLGGARVYTSADAQAQLQIIPLQTFPKEIVALSETPLGGAIQQVKIGEEVEYTLTANLPVARLRSFFIQDYLPVGLSCSEAPVVDLSQPPYDAAGFTRPDGSLVPPITPSCDSDSVIWNFGDVVLTQKPAGSNYFVFQVSFIARVDNSAANNEAVVLSNGEPATNTTLYYLDELNQQVILDFGQVDAVIREPLVALSKSFAPVVNADAADELTVSVTAINNGTANAYNLRILDDLTDRNMTFIQGSVSGADPPDSVDITTFGANQPLFSWLPANPLPPGATRNFTFRVRVETAAQPLEILDNTLQADWTSLPDQNTALNSTGLIGANGSATGMRIGALPNAGDAINDYEATASASVSVPPLVLSKTDLDPAMLPEIGAHKPFEIVIDLPEGTTNNLVATDNLAGGSVSYVLARNTDFDISYTFEGIASINGQPPAEAVFNSFPVDGASGSIAWDIGTVVTQTEDDQTINNIYPRIRIQYQARLNNDLLTDAGDTLQNGVTLTYNNGETGATETLNAATAQITATESLLSITKGVTAITPLPLTGGDILEYTITAVNNGDAMAYDVNLVDTLPPELWLDSSFTPTATINGTAVAGFVATPTGAPAGPLVWGRDNGDASLDIPAGDSLVLTYRAQVQGATGINFNNTVWVDWTSLQDVSSYERNGAGCPTWTAPNDYCAGAVSPPLSATDTTSISKTVYADSYTDPPSTANDAIVRVGDTAIYRLVLNLPEGNTRNLVITDQLPVGLTFTGIVNVNGDTTAPFEAVAPFVHGVIGDPVIVGDATTGSTLTWNLGNIYNTPDGDTTNDTFIIDYQVLVTPNTLARQPTTTLTNTVTLAYTDATGTPVPFDPARMQASADLTIWQPVIMFQKYVVNVTTGQDPGANASPGDILRYRIVATNVSPMAMDVTDFSITDEVDNLNSPAVFVPGSLTIISAPPGADTSNTDPNGGSNGTGLLDVRNLNLDAPGGANDVVTVEFEVTLAPVINSGTLVLNQANLQVYGLAPQPSDDPNVNGPDDPIVIGDEDPTQTLIDSAPYFEVYKISDDLTGDANTLLPGDTLRYTITVKNVGNENAVNVILQDTIPTYTSYVANSTLLNGIPVPDAGANSPLEAGMLINSPEDLTPGVMPANADPAANNTATIVFEVIINVDAIDGQVISNQGFVNGEGAGGIAFPEKPSDDPATPTPDDPTLDIVSRPNGVIYDSITRLPLAGATLTMTRAGTPLPANCFDDPAQQNQVTTADGNYKFDLNFSQAACPPGADYLIEVSAVPTGYRGTESLLIPPSSNAATAAYSVPLCPADAVPATTDRCEAQVSDTPPSTALPTTYYLNLTLDNPTPDDSEIYNNHIPVDPQIDTALTIAKSTPLVNVTRGQMVPYTITLENTLGGVLQNIQVLDQLPPGFKYVEGSSRLDGNPLEPVVTGNGRVLQWDNLAFAYDVPRTIQVLLIAGSGVAEGEYVNQAWARDPVSGENTEIATATVRVVPDPTFDCSDITGKVFDDRNLNGYQDEGEVGLAGVRLATARGLLVTTDEHGRFHVTCAVVPDEQRGSNFILKLDDRTLPSGYRVTTENPRVQRVTRGKMSRFNFGATVHHVVAMSVADGVFKPDSTEIRPQWLPRLGLLIEELRKQPSRLRLTYMADVESAGLVNDRIAKLKKLILADWKEVSDTELTIETEIFWRHGGPVDKNSELSDNLNLLGLSSGGFGNSKVGEDTEKLLPHGYTFTPWRQDPAQFKVETPATETEQVTEKNYTTKKLTNVVPAIPFSSGKAEIPDEFITKLRSVMESMRDRENVRLHFIGHTDNVQLSDELQKQYVDNFGLSKERAGTTAEFFQRALGLPPEAISYEGMGETKPIASNQTASGKARNRRVEVEVWYDEVSEQLVERKVEVDQEIKRIMVCRVETMCMLRYKQGHSRRTKLKNLVPPFHYDGGVSKIPAQYLTQLRQALRNLDGKDNVQIRFIGYTDNLPLNDRDARIYGDHTGLSKANARRVATAVQEALGLPNRAVSSTGKGADYPLASNNSEKGRALNRRIEVEFWHDDPLEDLPEEPQICPEAAAAETVERTYNPPEGDIQPIFFENGKPVIPEGYTKQLQRAMDDLSDKGNVRLRFVGYTSNKRLDRRTAMVYGDDIGLSTARARRAMEAIKPQMNLSDKQAEFEGRGYVQSHDVVNTGFIELDQSKVEVQVVYDELAILDENEGVAIKRITRDVVTQDPYALNLMRIVVDGQPLNDPNKGTADVQRCTDVALDQAQVNFKFDNLQIKPRLNVTAWPNVISFTDHGDTEFIENLTHFKLYTNYPAFISKAEVRLFNVDQSTRDTPVSIVPLNEKGEAQWQVELESYSTPRVELKYVLRVYDKHGSFDETTEQTLWIVDKLEADNSTRDPQKELLVGYGENRLGVNNIPLTGGAVSVYGKEVPADHDVWFAGHALPVAESGEFGGEFILPSGLHSVEVAITDEAGHGNVYQRDLELEKSDWFYVGIADVTVGRDSTNGPAKEVTGNDQHYNNDYAIDGRLAFYTKGQFANESVLTASADTREGPVDELFSNFMDKSPQALFRRLDPDYFYPTFGDDSTLEEDAPTSGKFYLKWQKDKNYGLWGNFEVAYLDNSLAHVDRGLYGGNLNYEGDATTSFGEKRFAANLFAAEPGTLAERDEFLGTGGSLYYLRRQDILIGSDRLRIEVRDAVSGLVMSVKNLTPSLDYDLDYIQGRIMLKEPLSATASSDMLVDSPDFGGSRVFLVARYEYTPGFEDINDIVTGGRAHYWIGDHVKLGMTLEDQEATGSEASLSAYDLTLRKNAGTWLKLEKSTSQGPVSSSWLSKDGGFEFERAALPEGSDVEAEGQRVDGSVRFEDISTGLNGKFTFYHQQLDAGYSAPGLIALTDTTQMGGTLEVPVFESMNVKLKADARDEEDGLETEAVELNVDYLLNNNWTFGLGLRNDSRTDNSASVELTQEQGDRTDAALRSTFDSGEDWLAYGYLQDTLDTSGNREENSRVGVGGDYRVSDRFNLNAELSTGDLGPAVKLGSNYKMTDATDVYSSYALENERTDNGVKARRGNFATGFKTQFSDSASIYMEERYTHGDVPTGLTHTMGFDLVVNDRWNLGGNIDIGTFNDVRTGLANDRTAAGFRIGYKFDALTYAGALEYRVDETEQPDTSFTERTTWLMKNSIKYALNPDWRLIGKLNYSQSESSLGDTYNGDFTEAVLGYAYRPVDNDKLNALFKYTYFYNLPTTDQVTLNNSAAQYIQKSHVLSFDFNYDLTRRWTLGGKYAHRFSQLSLDRENPDFFDSDASLYILRADWHFTRRWDALVEGRLLDVKQAGDTRSGMLLGVYRHLGDNIKMGVGYNFTDFSDDLTDLDYDSQGMFVNVIGKF